MDTYTVYRSGDALNEQERNDIWEILKLCDNEFYPPLSERSSSYQKSFSQPSGTAGSEGPRTYYNEMIKQEFLLTYIGEEMAGFMTFRTGYLYEKLGETYNPSLYMTTACVKPVYREHGIMSALYGQMEREMTTKFGCPVVTTRTWSTNETQMRMLTHRGYDQICVLKDDRGPGVDTVYFGTIKDTAALS